MVAAIVVVSDARHRQAMANYYGNGRQDQGAGCHDSIKDAARHALGA